MPLQVALAHIKCHVSVLEGQSSGRVSRIHNALRFLLLMLLHLLLAAWHNEVERVLFDVETGVEAPFIDVFYGPVVVWHLARGRHSAESRCVEASLGRSDLGRPELVERLLIIRELFVKLSANGHLLVSHVVQHADDAEHH